MVAPREFENSEDAHYYEKEGRNNRGKRKDDRSDSNMKMAYRRHVEIGKSLSSRPFTCELLFDRFGFPTPLKV